MTNFRSALLISVLFLLTLGISNQGEAKILTKCEAVTKLQNAGISRTMISNWICLMQSESGLDTSLVNGPLAASSFSYGVFQINSQIWCTRGRKGGICNKRCEDFADDDITDDIVCAKKIQSQKGFDQWGGWVKQCKKKPLPSIAECKRRR